MKLAAVSVASLALATSLASAQTFMLSGAGAIPDATTNQVEGVALNMGSGPVSGTFATIENVGVSFTMDPGHTFAGDLIIRLTYDAGSDSTIDATIFIVNRIGRTTPTGFGDSSNMAGLYSFVDGGADIWAAAGLVGDTAAIPANTAYAPSDSNNAPQSFATVFGGLSSSGTWNLSFTDSANLDTGSVFSASVVISTVPTPGAAAAIDLAGLITGRRRR